MKNSAVVLFVCSGLLLSGGAILGGSAGWSVLRMSYHFWTSDLGVELSSAVMLVAGCILCLPACWLATLVPYHTRTVSLLGTLMFLSTVAMLMLSSGLTSLQTLSQTVRNPQTINDSMHRAMARAQFDPSVRHAFSSMQLELRCCGVDSYTDWYKHRRTLPAACCNRWTPAKSKDVCENAFHTSGCLTPTLIELRYFINTMSAFTSIMIIILSVTLFSTAYTLVSSAIKHGELRILKSPMQMACIHSPASFAPAPMLSFIPPPTSPAPPITQSSTIQNM